MAHNNLGNVLSGQGPVDEAIACFEGHRTRPEARQAHIQPGQCAVWPRASWTRPSPATARPSNSTRSTPRPTATWAMRWRPRASSTRPSPATARPSNSTRSTPAGPNWTGAGRAAGGRPGQAARLPQRRVPADDQRRAPRPGRVLPGQEAIPHRGPPVRRRLRRRPQAGRRPARPVTATTPPAPPPWPPPARARTPPSSTTRNGPGCASRPSTGSAPTWPCGPSN